MTSLPSESSATLATATSLPRQLSANGLYGFEGARLESQAADLQEQRWAVDAELHRGRRRSRVTVIRGPCRRCKRVDVQWRMKREGRCEDGGVVGARGRTAPLISLQTSR